MKSLANMYFEKCLYVKGRYKKIDKRTVYYRLLSPSLKNLLDNNEFVESAYKKKHDRYSAKMMYEYEFYFNGCNVSISKIWKIVKDLKPYHPLHYTPPAGLDLGDVDWVDVFELKKDVKGREYLYCYSPSCNLYGTPLNSFRVYHPTIVKFIKNKYKL